MKIFSNPVISRSIILVFLLMAGAVGCGSENIQKTEESSTIPFPEDYVAEEFLLSEDTLAISAVAVCNSVLYFSAIKDISGNKVYDADTSELIEELCYIDFLSESIIPITVPFSVRDNNRISRIFSNNDGTVDLVVQTYDELKESGVSEITETVIKRISLEGKELFSYSIMKDVKNQEIISISDFMTDSEGNAYAIIRDILYAWNAEGELLYATQISGSLSQLSKSRDGSAYLIWMGVSEFQIALVNLETGIVDTKKALSENQIYLDMAAGVTSDLLLATSEGIYEYDTEQGMEKKIISFPQIDVPAGLGGKLFPLSNDKIAWLQAGHNKNTITIIRGAEKTELTQKETLILGGTVSAIMPWHHEAVANFNNTSKNVRIEIKIYGSGENDSGIEELNIDIANGKGPDIMILPSQFSMDLYARKEVLVDLYPYIDSDEYLERSNFQENILQAYEIDGKLYGIPIYYWIKTMVAGSSVVGEVSQWNLDEMIAFAEQYMPNSTVFDMANKSSVLHLCLMANGESLIDWTDGGQGFKGELLAKMLVFADRFAPDHVYNYDERLIERIQDEGQIQILCNQTIMGFVENKIYLGAFGERVSYPGYPSENGNGNLIHSNFVMAINNACSDKDAAWQFINSLLAEEFQWSDARLMGFPIRKDVLERMIEAEMEISYKTDENGIKTEEKRQTFPFGIGEVDVYASREEDIQTVLAMINSADKIQIWNGTINDIVFEEAGAFFDGSKTVDEVVDIIESRSRIYINELK